MNKESLSLPEGIELNLDFDSLSDEEKAEILAVINNYVGKDCTENV